MVELEPRALLDPVGHDEVAVASRTTVRPPAAPAEAGDAPAAPTAAGTSTEPEPVVEAVEAAEATNAAETGEPAEAGAAEVGVPVAVPDTDPREPRAMRQDPGEEPGS